jgi:hypothetical protein
MHSSVRVSIVLSLLLAGALWFSPASLAQEAPNFFTGSQYKIFLYGGGIDTPAVTLSFDDSYKLLIDAFDGVGVYLPAGRSFAAVFSTPEYKTTGKTLLLMFSGTVVGDFIVGAGVAALDFALQGSVIFAGYLK